MGPLRPVQVPSASTGQWGESSACPPERSVPPPETSAPRERTSPTPPPGRSPLRLGEVCLAPHLSSARQQAATSAAAPGTDSVLLCSHATEHSRSYQTLSCCSQQEHSQRAWSAHTRASTHGTQTGMRVHMYTRAHTPDTCTKKPLVPHSRAHAIHHAETPTQGHKRTGARRLVHTHRPPFRDQRVKG